MILRRPHWLTIESYGLLLVLLSAVLYAYAGAFVKLAHTSSDKLPSTELVFARGIFQGTLILLGLYVSRNEKGVRLICFPFGTGPARRIVWWRGILGGAGFLLDYHCMAVLPLGDAITLMSLYPFLTLFLARIFLGEEIRAVHLASTVASFAGAVFIAQPTFVFGKGDSEGVLSSWGYVTGLLGSVCLACVLTLIRKGGLMGVHTFQLLLSWALFGIIFSVIFGPYEGQWKWPSSGLIWWYVSGVCVVGAGTHFMLNYAGRLAPAGLVSVIRASDILFAYGFELFIFGQKPNGYTWVGVILVLGSLVAIASEKIRDAKRLRKKLSVGNMENGTDEAVTEEHQEEYDIESIPRKSKKKF